MKKIVLVLVTSWLLCLASGCKDQPAGPGSASVLNGRIESWTPSYGNRIYAIASGLFGHMEVDSTSVSAFGTFTFHQPLASPPSYLLRPPLMEPSDSTAVYKLQDSLKFSNPNVRYIELHLALPNPLARYGPNFSQFIYLYSGSSVTAADSLLAAGDYRVQYFYFSERISITGRYGVFFYDSSLAKQMHREIFITDYNVTVPAGWSAVTTRLVSDDGRTRRYQVTGGDVADKSWFIPSSASMSLPGARSL